MNFTFVKSNKFLSFTFSLVADIFFSLVRVAVKKNKIGKTLVIVLHRLGDCIFTLSAIKQIINHYKTNIVIVCFPETTDIFKISLKDVEFLELKHSDFYLANRFASSSARVLLRKLKPSTIFDLTGSVTSASLIFNSNASKIIGTNESYYKRIYDHYVPLRTEPHVMDIYLDAIKPVINVNKNIRLNNDQQEIRGAYIGIHPFAGWKAKEWSLRKFILLAEHLSKKFTVKLVTPPQKISYDVLCYLKEKRIEVVETKTTKQLIEFISGAFLFIGNDSGPVHIANLLGIPTFTIYGPTNPTYHAPTEGINQFIIKQLKCSPKVNEKVCFTNGGRNGCPSFECVESLNLDAVKFNINDLLKKISIKT